MSAVALTGWLGFALSLALGACGWRRASLRALARRRACHELRGALTAARLGVELELRAGRMAASRHRALELEFARGAAALDDLADGAQGGWGLRPCRPRRWSVVDVAQLLADSVEACAPAARARGVELQVSWSGPPGTVYGDRARLARVTANLIANALEHGAGPVLVSGRADATRVRVEVLDAGPGLSAPVARLARGAGRRRTRRGHGLAIACAVAAAHGGQLAAAPSDSGARLVLELPAINAGLQAVVH
jgi:signal transduction histidine kinase